MSNEERKFSVKESAFVFQLLSSNLYEDPIKAIIRELGANAADAHIAAGKQDTQWRLTLPSVNDEHFRLRDFGTGLSHADMLDLYTAYFFSTKGDDADQTGCFGLGSKTPFAYVKNYFVVSRFEGTKNTYKAFLNKEGEPVIKRTQSVDCDEENGLEIIFRVEPEDFSTFEQKAAQVLQPFEFPPEVRGVSGFVIPEKTKIFEGDDWFIYEQDRVQTSRHYYGHGRETVNAYLSVGHVVYPLAAKSPELEQSKTFKKILNTRLLIDAPIGSVDIAPSRETLTYSKKTVKYLLEKANEIQGHVAEGVLAAILNAPTVYEARKKAYELPKANTYNPQIADRDCLQGLEYNGKTLNLWEVFGQIKEDRMVTAQWTSQQWNSKAGGYVDIVCKDTRSAIDPTDYFNEKVKFVFGSAIHGNRKTSTYLKKSLSDPSLTLFGDPSRVKSTSQRNPGCVYVYVEDKDAIQGIIDALELPAARILHLKDIPNVKAKSTSSGPRAPRFRTNTQAKLCVINKYKIEEDVEIDITAGGVFIKKYRDQYQVSSSERYNHEHNLRSALSNLEAFLGEDHIVDQVVIVNGQQANILDSLDNWEWFHEAYHDDVLRKFEDPKIVELCKRGYLAESTRNSGHDHALSKVLRKVSALAEEEGRGKDFLDKYQACGVKQDVDSTKCYAAISGLSWNYMSNQFPAFGRERQAWNQVLSQQGEEATKRLDELVAQYPMLALLPEWYRLQNLGKAKTLSTILDYIESVDKMKCKEPEIEETNELDEQDYTVFDNGYVG